MELISLETARIENFLAREIGAPKIFFIKLLRKGKIQINNIKASIGDRVIPNDKIQVSTKVSIRKEIYDQQLSINMYEFKEFFVINKPYGICSQGGSKVETSIDKAMIAIADKRKTKSFIVHRLDKNTTGTMVFAKNVSFTQIIGKMFQNHQVKKAYIALLDGCLSENKEIEAEIDNKKAISLFLPIYTVGNKTLCMIFIKFGRKHQIRIHASLLGYPLYRDLYGDGRGNIFLHCFSLSFCNFTFFTQLPKIFYAYIKKNSTDYKVCFMSLMEFYYKNENSIQLLII